MSVRCLIKFRTWDEKKGLNQTQIEAKSLEELFHQLVDSSERNNIHSIILDGPDKDGQHTQLTLEASSLVKN